jgi:hypothetical protein
VRGRDPQFVKPWPSLNENKADIVEPQNCHVTMHRRTGPAGSLVSCITPKRVSSRCYIHIQCWADVWPVCSSEDLQVVSVPLVCTKTWFAQDHKSPNIAQSV